jgi:hypothetical protein
MGIMVKSNKEKYDTDDFWVDILVDSYCNKDPWKSDENMKLHTDNCINNEGAVFSELICISPSVCSGETFIISNNDIVKIMKKVDEFNGTNLYDSILNKMIYHTYDNVHIVKKPILLVEGENYSINFNYHQAKKCINNSEEDQAIIDELDYFLDKYIVNSELMTIIKLEQGDSLIFNDTKVMHGRRSIIGRRHLKRCLLNVTLL